MNGTWGFKSYDHNWKSTETLVRNLVDIVSKGGNYLLNVGPTAEGEIPQPSIDRLKAVGRWMQANGESIYGTTASPTRRPAWGRITTKAGDAASTLFLHVFAWPGDGRLPVLVSNEVQACHLLVDPERKFEVARGEDGLTVALTGEAPDAICSVVVLTIKGRPQAVVRVIRQGADGRVILPATDAELKGALKVESKDGKPNIGYWLETGDSAAWPFKLDKPGEFEVVGDLASQGASRFSVRVGQSALDAEMAGTGDYAVFKDFTLGRVKIDKPGMHRLIMKPKRNGWSPVNVRTLTLRPVAP
jgi:alpha-L-fucosidase